MASLFFDRLALVVWEILTFLQNDSLGPSMLPKLGLGNFSYGLLEYIVDEHEISSLLMGMQEKASKGHVVLGVLPELSRLSPSIVDSLAHPEPSMSVLRTVASHVLSQRKPQLTLGGSIPWLVTGYMDIYGYPRFLRLYHLSAG